MAVEKVTFTDEELAAFGAEHICYEVGIAAQTAVALSSGAMFGKIPWSALTVASLVHLRLLDEFLGRSERATRAGKELPDVLATDYTTNVWSPVSPLDAFDLRDPINVQVAHLSMDRQLEPQWDIVTVTSAVLAAFSGFEKEVRPPFDDTFGPAIDIVGEFNEWVASLVPTWGKDDHPSYIVGGELVTSTNSSDVLTWQFHRHAPVGS